MSASTVSVTPNPAASTRRRSVLASENKKINAELLENNAVSSDARAVANDEDKIAGGISKDLSHSITGEEVLERSKDMFRMKKPLLPNSTVSPRRARQLASSKAEKPLWQTLLSVFRWLEDKIAGGISKDLSHSITGEEVLERSKDMFRMKKPLLPNSTVSPRRARQLASSKAEKPLWQTLLSVFTKNFLLLLVLAGLVQMVRRLVINLRSDVAINLVEFSDMEARIAAVESIAKARTEMLKDQLEAVGKKMEGEVSSLRGEMDEKFDKNSEDIASRLMTFDEKNKSIKKALDQLKSKDLLSREDFERLYEEFGNSKIGESDHADLSLDDVGELAKQIVGKEIEKHAADGLGKVDYAIATGGGIVVKHSEPLVVGKGGKLFSMTMRQGVHIDAEKMWKPSFGDPGHCFPLKGDSGFVQIKLRKAIIPDALTLEHVSKSVAYDRSSAPKDCRVYGWLQGTQGVHGLGTDSFSQNDKMLLTKFTYDLDKSNSQTFNVFESASSEVVDTIRFDFTSNHGSPSHTCIYRFRVHGHEPNSLSHLDAL